VTDVRLGPDGTPSRVFHVSAWERQTRAAAMDEHAVASRLFRVSERQSGHIKKDPELQNELKGTSIAFPANAQWENMEASVQSPWLSECGPLGWAAAFDFLLDAWIASGRRGGVWRVPNPALYLTPEEWVEQAVSLARDLGLPALASRARKIREGTI
jgi:hypothetical protein